MLYNNSKLIAALAFLLLTTAACKKSFLDLTDPTRIETNEYYKDSSSIGNAVTACYASLQDEYGRSGGSRGIFPYAEVTSDNSYAVVEGTGIGEFEYFSFTSANPVLQSSWQYMYRGIARCNIVLNRAPAVTFTDSVKRRYLAEAKFIRALTYFNMVRIWGDVPLVTTEISTVESSYQYTRTPATQVYAQIIKDLQEATPDLPIKYASTNDLGRITRGAAQGILAKVYLTQKDYTNAVSTLSSFYSTYNGVYSLLPNYADIFSTSNEMNAEIIAAVRYKKGGYGTGSPFANYFAPQGKTVVTVGNGYEYNLIKGDLADTFKTSGTAGDKRYAASIGGTTTTKPYTMKYLDVPTTDVDADNDWIILRWADVLLMYAEALNEQNAGNVAQAVEYVNKVRARAGFSGTGLLATTLTQADLRLAIERERRLELNMEGHRWFDLVRTGRAIEVMNRHFKNYNVNLGANVVQIDNHNLLFPVPINEINTNGALTQNPGY